MSIPSTPKVPAERHDDMLSAQEELTLARAWRHSADRAARDRLIASHLPLVMRMATRLRGYRLSLDDLVAEGNVGLIRAVESFDPDRGARFATYAQWWVRASMYEYVLKFSTPVSFPITADRRRIFFKLKGLRARLMGPNGGHLTAEQREWVAGELKVSPRTVAEMENLICLTPRSLDAPVTMDGTVSLGELLPDDRPDAATELGERQGAALRRRALAQSWPALSEREQSILTGRTLREPPLRLDDLAKQYAISRERVRQIEGEALRKLRRLMSPPAANFAS